jgi:hypothetical protein
MKILKSSLLLLSVFIITAAFAPAKKAVYENEEAKFSVTFPGEYTTETEKGENVTTVKIICTYENQTYFASYSLHELTITDHMEMAEVSYDSFKEAVGGQTLSRSEWDIDNHKGLRSVMDLTESGVKLEYRVILLGNIQYQLVAMAANADYDEKAAAKFFKSFKLMD